QRHHGAPGSPDERPGTAAPSRLLCRPAAATAADRLPRRRPRARPADCHRGSARRARARLRQLPQRRQSADATARGTAAPRHDDPARPLAPPGPSRRVRTRLVDGACGARPHRDPGTRGQPPLRQPAGAGGRAMRLLRLTPLLLPALAACSPVQSALHPTGAEAERINTLFWVMTIGGSVILLLVCVLTAI